MAQADLTDAELFDAAVSYSRRKGKLKAESDADPEKSRSTGMNFVLATAENRVIDRIPLDKLYQDAEKMQDIRLPDTTKGWKDLPVAAKVAFILVPSVLLLNFCSSGGGKPSPPRDLQTRSASKPPDGWFSTGLDGIFVGYCHRRTVFPYQMETPECQVAVKKAGEDSYPLVVMVWCRDRPCGGIYIEANQVSENGSVMGWTNDTGNGQYGDVVYLSLRSYYQGESGSSLLAQPKITKCMIGRQPASC
jgi:hypothetical protein